MLNPDDDDGPRMNGWRRLATLATVVALFGIAYDIAQRRQPPIAVATPPDTIAPDETPGPATTVRTANLDSASDARRNYAQFVAPFLDTHCAACHGPDRQKSGIRFDEVSADPLGTQAVELWKRATEQLEAGSMPPKSQPRPDTEAQAKVLAWMREQIQRSQVWPSPPLRRLTRTEYANAVADLLGVREDLHDLLPEELTNSDGFTNEAELLHSSTLLVEAYLKAAQFAAARVIQPVKAQTWTLRIEDANPMTCSQDRKLRWDKMPKVLNNPFDMAWSAVARQGMLVFRPKMHDYAVGDRDEYTGTFYFHLLPITVPVDGMYRIRLRVCALNHSRTPARVRITYSDVTNLGDYEVALALAQHPFIESNVTGTFADEKATYAALMATHPDLPPDQLQTVDPVLATLFEQHKTYDTDRGPSPYWMKRSWPIPTAVREQAIERSEWIECTGRLPAGLIKLTISGEDLQPNRWLFITADPVLEGPLLPSSPELAEVTAVVAQEDAAGYARWLAGIMTRAYRRPAPAEEAAGLIQRMRDNRAGGTRSFSDAARLALASVLCAPEFFTVLESTRKNPAAPRLLNGRELATRMALFLWRGLPDENLMRQAQLRHGLSGVAGEAQVDAMLADPRIGRFIHEFNDGWLGLKDFEAVQLDARIFPHAQGIHLHQSMRREPDEFIAHLIKSDASILDVLRCEYVVVNQRLAEYYGLGQMSFQDQREDTFQVVQAPPRAEVTLGAWSAIGPFAASDGGAAHRNAYEPEKEIKLDAKYNGGALQWSAHPDWADGVPHNLTGENCAWYLTRTITASSEQDVQLSLGSDDGLKLWIDGDLAIDRDVYRAVAADQDVITVHLTRGEHRILFKINNGSFGYAFYFRVVDRPEFRRGGVMGMAAMLMQTSQTTRTAPVRRGVWFLENLLGTPPPPPPPKAREELARAESAATPQMSRRQILELHRSNATCASCHARFDPFGFALESFGPDGLWRTFELHLNFRPDGSFSEVSQGPTIDPSGELLDGRKFKDVTELQHLLRAEPRPFVHALAKKLLTFALGRRLGPQDSDSIDFIVRSAYANDFRMRAVLKAVVACDAFQKH